MKQAKRWTSISLAASLTLGIVVSTIALPAQATLASKTNKEHNKHFPTHEKTRAVINERNVVPLVADAILRMQHVQNGGTLKDGLIKTFWYKGKEYRYLGTDINSWKKLMNYLNQSLTPQATAAYIKSAGIIEYKDQLAQVNADKGDLREWRNAQASFVKGTGTQKEYELKIPYQNGRDVSFSIIRVKVEYIKWAGWRVASFSEDVPVNPNPERGLSVSYTTLVHSALPVQEENKLPPEIKRWLDQYRANEGVWFYTVKGYTYVLIARGETPNPGYDIQLDGITEFKDIIEVRAHYTNPDPHRLYPAVVTHPVIVLKLDEPTTKKVRFQIEKNK